MKNGASSGPPGLAVFQQNGCSSCHTFKPANATGKIGPDLDNLKADGGEGEPRSRSTRSSRSRSSIRPRTSQPGYSDLMPHIFKQQIPPDQLQQLVQYLSQGAK